MTITRRNFLATGALVSTPFFPAIISNAYAAVTLTLGHGAAPNNPRSVASEYFAKLVAEKTKGAVKINIAGSEQLGSDAAMLTSLRTGVLDFTVNSQGATSAVVPELNVVGLPFLFKDTAQAFKVLQGPVGKTLEERFDKTGLHLLSWWDNGIRHVTNSKRPINTPEDLRGLKIRVPPGAMGFDIFKTLGASPEQIAFGELYLALQQGVVDGQENPLANIDSSKLYEVNPFISLTGHSWEATPFFMSRMTRGKVGAPELAAIREAANEAGTLQRSLMQKSDEVLFKELGQRKGVQINQVDRAAFQKATMSIAENWKKRPFGNLVTQIIDEAGR